MPIGSEDYGFKTLGFREFRTSVAGKLRANMGGVSPKVGVPLKGVILGLYRDNGKENGNYYLGFRD